MWKTQAQITFTKWNHQADTVKAINNHSDVWLNSTTLTHWRLNHSVIIQAQHLLKLCHLCKLMPMALTIVFQILKNMIWSIYTRKSQTSNTARNNLPVNWSTRRQRAEFKGCFARDSTLILLIFKIFMASAKETNSTIRVFSQSWNARRKIRANEASYNLTKPLDREELLGKSGNGS